jgi:hypothetical protein
VRQQLIDRFQPGALAGTLALPYSRQLPGAQRGWAMTALCLLMAVLQSVEDT